MTNENEAETTQNVSTGTDSLVLPKSPRKVSIASNLFSKRLSTAQPSEDGATPLSSKLDMGALFRRRSTFKGLAQSITNAIAMRRMTKSSVDVPQKPKIKMENTYKLNPDEGKLFYPSRVNQAINDVLHSYLDGVTYNPKTAGTLTGNITDMIKSRVKLLKFDRFKIICNVMLGQSSDQGMQAASRCLWDQKTDNFSCISYKNKSIIAIVTVFGIYYE